MQIKPVFCEVRYRLDPGKLGEFQGRQFPSQMAIRYGDIDYGLFEFKSVDVTPSNDPVK